MPVVAKFPDHRRNLALAGVAESAVKAIGRDDRTTSDTRGVSAYSMGSERTERQHSVIPELDLGHSDPRQARLCKESLTPQAPEPGRTRIAENWTHAPPNWTHFGKSWTHQVQNWTHWPDGVDTSPSSRRSWRPALSLPNGGGSSLPIAPSLRVPSHFSPLGPLPSLN